MKVSNNFLSRDFKGWESQTKEVVLDNLKVDGQIPSWISGSLIANGPAQFEVGTTHFKHWFDGFAMIKKFTFDSGKVSFRNRFLLSEQYAKSNANGGLYKNGFETYAIEGQGHIQRVLYTVKNLFQGQSSMLDDCNVHILKIGEHFGAVTETSNIIKFDQNDLRTIGSLKFDDDLPAFAVSTAHPHLDVDTGEMINVLVEFGRENKHHIYKIAPNSLKREIIATYPPKGYPKEKQPFYVHSFSITPNYVILFKTPLVLSPLKLLFNYTFNDALSYKKKIDYSSFVIINRKNGDIREIQTDPFICLHSANAYEHRNIDTHQNEIILDLVCYDMQSQSNIYSPLFLSDLKEKGMVDFDGTLKRYTVNLNTEKCHHRSLPAHSSPVEFPRINYKAVNGKKYNFLYTTAMTGSRPLKFYNSVQKINLQDEKIQLWGEDNYYFGEPIFVPRNNDNSQGNDGVLLAIAYNDNTKCSSIVVIDAHSMQKIGEAHLPIHLPFGLHGNFYRHNSCAEVDNETVKTDHDTYMKDA
ncbi:hypothetical protein BIY23_00995 [Wolbachia pipientis]|uniref:Dioxygenase n=1 Tax=Wolbachia pipientis TaxID=955 RepID=A0A1E7QKP5_WOLPI|nr:carotenoid oxygenase family protein [Wolbachia pipientis]OEY87050.1 hypothetical protein BIY23_00995 [Wolbachia pipientis]